VEFFEAPAFSRHVRTYLTDDEYASLQVYLTMNPEAGDVMPGTGGFRKLRWSDESRGKGKRGGLRVIYYFMNQQRQIWLFTLFGQNEAPDLTPEQKRQLRGAIDAELEARRTRSRIRRFRS